MKSAKKRRGLAILVIALCLTVMAGCSKTFVVTKDGRGYFFGSSRDELYKMLCESGDLKKILNDTHLPQEIKDSLFKYNCEERSGDKVKEIYAGLTPEQRRELRLTFQLHGYDINYLPC